ncbi:ArnT family glycosyltransferase [Hymenobacter sp. 102]|uniref:ArnT family glycosyltransferase n=1 Tax=Hymenobacter sp. 102 TaxID=3403152 RepID=UPI003CE9B76E
MSRISVPSCLLLLLGWLATAPLFLYGLGKPPVSIWDEGRVGVNAAWILRTTDWLVLRADPAYDNLGPHPLRVWQQPAGETVVSPWLVSRSTAPPDTWNTKPPLMPWLQALSMQWFGASAWAMRLPAALSGWLTVGVLLAFGAWGLGRPGVGLLAGFILATMPLFNSEHVTRTGDYDALLALCTTTCLLSAWIYLRNGRSGWLFLAALSLALALLCKSAAACLPLPPLAIYALADARRRAILRHWPTWVALGAAFLPLLAFYVLRERAAPGFVAASWYNDWAGRFGAHLTPGHRPWWLYVHYWFHPGLSLWSPVLLASVVAVARQRNLPEYLRFLTWQIAGTMVLLSLAQNRAHWYAAPLLPLLALLTAGLLTAWRDVWARRWPAFAGAWQVGVGLLVMVEAVVLVQTHERQAGTLLENSHLAYEAALPLIATSTLPRPELIVLRDEFNSALDFILLTLPASYRPLVLVMHPRHPAGLRSLRAGQQVLGTWPEDHAWLATRFRLVPLVKLAGPAWCVRLEPRRPAPDRPVIAENP